MIKSLDTTATPADVLTDLLQQPGESCVFFQFNHVEYYSTGGVIQVGVICYTNQDELRVAVSVNHEAIKQAIQSSEENVAPPLNGESELRATYNKIVADRGIADIDFFSPLALDTVKIAKPWGQEIWYTGIEERGVCSVQNIPLPWLLDLAGPLLTGTESPTPILLKILDPLSDEVAGDLYFELHKEKREVYVVTHIDKSAWPDSIGQIRYGFNPEKIKTYENDEQFKAAYLASVDKYRMVRNRIDRNPIDAHPELEEEEKTLRNKMEEFTSLRSLRVGDVIQVHPFTPHSLQHGVRVVEFQTPHYERFILSFAQKVLTQDHWDTNEAMDCVRVLEPPETKTETETRLEHSLIADFDEFSVTRIVLEPGATEIIERSTYSLVMGVQGEAQVNNLPVHPEEGFYIPACIKSLNLTNTRAEQATLLIAQPAAQEGNKS
jgi:hypothetical protein